MFSLDIVEAKVAKKGTISNSSKHAFLDLIDHGEYGGDIRFLENRGDQGQISSSRSFFRVLFITSKLPVQSWTEISQMKLEGNHYFLCLTLSNPNILKTISNSSRVISEKTSFRRTILIFPTDPDVAIQSLSLTVFGNVKLENILCKIYRFVKSVIV